MDHVIESFTTELKLATSDFSLRVVYDDDTRRYDIQKEAMGVEGPYWSSMFSLKNWSTNLAAKDYFKGRSRMNQTLEEINKATLAERQRRLDEAEKERRDIFKELGKDLWTAQHSASVLITDNPVG